MFVFATESFPLDNQFHPKSENGLAFGFNVGTVTEGVITEILGILIGEAKTTFIIGSLGCDMLGKFIFSACLFIYLAFIPAFIIVVLISSYVSLRSKLTVPDVLFLVFLVYLLLKLPLL